MAFNFTTMQQKAIETKGNVLVSAAAGSGKTAVLVERVIKMLCDKDSQITADRLLIVTFTNAAAAEMRSRIEKRLCEEIQKDPSNTSLIKQKYLLASANICTIDSFCIKLVRENFEKCGIEPDFKISDESQQKNIAAKVMKNLIAEYLAEPQDDFKRLLELTGCEYDEKNLTELINRIYLYSQQLPFPQNFINGLLKPYESKFDSGNDWYDMAFESAQKKLDTAGSYAQNMLDSAQHIDKNAEKFVAYAEACFDMVNMLKESISLKCWDTFVDALNNVSFDRVPTGDKEDIFVIAFKEKQKLLKEVLKELFELFYDTIDNMQHLISQNYNSVKLLVDIINEYSKRLFNAFCEENTFTFYNMEQLALNLLCEYKNGEVIIRDDTAVLCGRYDEVLVDEYQDVNDLQNMLFYVLSNREEKLFVVGDIKQSIYGFRGSNPDNFLHKKNTYVSIEQAKENDAKKIVLSDNFRSRKGVCNTVNFFFSNLLAGQCGSVVYGREEQLNASRIFPKSNTAAAELLVIDKYDNNEDISLLELESQKIAEYILSLINEGEVISDGDIMRKARFCDIAILLDKVKDKAPIIAQTLNEYGIPVSLGGDSFLESIEISTVMSLLQVIDNPKCDVELLSVMMSPIFGFSAEEMAKIRAHHKTGQLFSAVLSYSRTGDKKTADFIKVLTELRHDAAMLSVDRLVSKLVHSTDILNQMIALSGGKTRQANLFSLIKFAKGYEEHSAGGIYGFLKYMKSLPETAFKSSVAGGDNAVKIMSMHNSKGLQFPVCIIANLTSQINNADSVSRVLFSEKGGIAFKYYDEESNCDVRMLGHAVMAEAANTKTTEEKLRLLYVAMTRAVDKLCLVCANKNTNDKLKKLASKLSNTTPFLNREFLEGSRNMGDWILACALMHPQGKVLCRYADINVMHTDSESDLKITVFNSFDNQSKADEYENSEDNYCDLKLAEKIKSNMQYAYPYEKLRFLQSKASVSSLVHTADDDTFAFCEKPAFMTGNKLSGAARGTALHHIMQFINFTETVDVKAELDRLVEWKFISEQEADSVDITAIEKFFNSDVYSRIIASIKVHREMRFLSEIPAGKFNDEFKNVDGADIIVQGAVDLCFEEPDGIVVLDFKTDRQDDPQKLKEFYAEQLNIYSAAVEKIFDKPVKEKIIYSLYLGYGISF